MRALVLAAGRGSRLQPLTNVTPKPLLEAAPGVRLCDWTLAGLKRAGITEVVMNTAHLPQAFGPLPAELARRGLTLRLSREGATHAESLESLGGVVRALPLLTDGGRDISPVLVVAGDIAHDYDFSRLFERAREIEAGEYDVFVVAVPNPPFHPEGDLTVRSDGLVERLDPPYAHTYGCILVVNPRIFAGLEPVYAKLFPWLWQFAQAGRMRGEVFTGFWANVGTAGQLRELAADAGALERARF